MPSRREHESMEKMDRCYKVVQQSSTKGINAAEIGKKLGIHRSTVHRNLVSLELIGKVENTGGMWRAKTGEQTIQPLEKEIVIELPIHKNEWQRMALMEHYAKDWEEHFPDDKDNAYRIMLEKIKETRTIRIKGKNVDDLDLTKIGNLIQQANEKSYLASLRGLFKGFRKSNSQNSPPDRPA